MKPDLPYKPALLLLLGVGTAAAPGCSPPVTRALATETRPVPVVEYVTLRAPAGDEWLELPGTVAAERTATLKAPMAGQLRELGEEGALLRGGQPAALLEATGLPSTVATTEAALEAARRRETAAGTAVDQATRDRELLAAELEQSLKAAEAEQERRQAQLAETRHQLTTEPARLRAQVQAAEARVRLLKSGERVQRLKQIEAEIEVARAEIEVAETQLLRVKELYAAGLAARRELELAALTVRRTRSKRAQLEEELKLQKEGAHPEAIREAEQQAEAARQVLRAAGALAEQLNQRKADLAAAEAEVTRLRQKLEGVRADRLTVARARSEAQATTAETRRLRAELTEARDRLARASVKAPFAGQVVRRHAQPGETVMAGAPLLDLVDPDALRFQAGIPEGEVSRLAAGTRVEVLIPTVSTQPLRGRIAEVLLASDAARQSYVAQIDLAAANGLRAGMAGTVRVARSRKRMRQDLRLPLTSLRKHFPREQRGEVWVLMGDRVEARPVRLGATLGAEVAVTGGLRPGEKIVVSETGGDLPGGTVRAREVTP